VGPPPSKSLTGRPFLNGHDRFCEGTLEESRERTPFKTFHSLAHSVSRTTSKKSVDESMASWEPLGASWEPLGTSWGLLGPSLGPLGTSWEPPVASWASLGTLLGLLGGLLGASWGPLGASWGCCMGTRGNFFKPSWEIYYICVFCSECAGYTKPSWVPLGASWGPLGGILALWGPLGGFLGTPCNLLGASWGCLGIS
jgi:hypothetical protein